MKVAIVGATGLVGQEMLAVLAERNFPLSDLIPVASARSIGKMVSFKGKSYPIRSLQEAIALAPDVALFSAGGSVSLEYAPQFAAVGTTVIDNSSAWRMHQAHKLVVPEVNGDVLTAADKIIANPNCSTIQMVVALKPLHDAFKIKRIVVSTYQSVTGTGKEAVEQLMAERKGENDVKRVYPHPIDLNVLPHIDVFLDNGYTKEEMKMVNETKKILNDYTLGVTATTVRIPVMGGHSEAVNVEFERDFDLQAVRQILENAKGVVVQDDVKNNLYPMPLLSHQKDEVFVGRIRRDESQPHTLNLWIVADNLRKGAATNAVQIAEYLLEKQILKPSHD
ncbi:aspartate-semialdehyde dehydrogenase [Hugenholtzia roseola]|uniref:aspartate-semialdehyde dehydrogenase n=1 Tax=Hugenholtzia roseola TaxID=1002 RepID=UPI0003F5B351|nr:aspartate-semialdehyde dehydrogenase [Hugenholtzia roseola]